MDIGVIDTEDSLIFKVTQDKIEEIFSQYNQYTFLVGAGISIEFPSNLPSAKSIRDSLYNLVISSDLNDLQIKYDIRYETIIEAFQQCLDPTSSFLDFFESTTTPNIFHNFLARAIHAHNFVITTNFDYLIEYALLKVIPQVHKKNLKIIITKNDFLNTDVTKETGNFLLCKIHGSSRNILTNQSTKESIITTFSDMGRDRSQGETFSIEYYKKVVINQMLKGRTLVVMGYSGNDDFDIIPLLSQTRELKSIVWIEHNDSIDKLIIEEVSGINNLVQSIHDDSLRNRISKLISISQQSGKKIYWIRINSRIFIEKVFSYLFPNVSISSIQSTPSNNINVSFNEWVSKNYRNILPSQRFKFDLFLMKKLELYDLATKYWEKNWKGIKNGTPDFPSLSPEDKYWFFLNMGKIYAKKNFDSSIANYIDALLEISKGDIPKICEILFSIAFLYEEHGKYEPALEIYNTALNISKYSNNTLIQAELSNYLGFLYYKYGNIPSSLKNLSKSLELFDKAGDLEKKALVLKNLGIIYKTQGDLNKAKDVLELSQRINTVLGNSNELKEIDRNLQNIIIQNPKYISNSTIGRKSSVDSSIQNSATEDSANRNAVQGDSPKVEENLSVIQIFEILLESKMELPLIDLFAEQIASLGVIRQEKFFNILKNNPQVLKKSLPSQIGFTYEEILDFYVFKYKSSQYLYHQIYNKQKAVDEPLVTGFFEAMSMLITLMPEKTVKSVPAGSYRFVYGHVMGFVFLICCETGSDKNSIPERLQYFMKTFEKEFKSIIHNPNFWEIKKDELSDILNPKKTEIEFSMQEIQRLINSLKKLE